MPSWPMLRERLPRLREARRALIDVERAHHRARSPPTAEASPEADWFTAQQTLKDDLAALADAGHPAARSRDRAWSTSRPNATVERVFLCWRLGEERVAWFHERARRVARTAAAVTGDRPVVVVLGADARPAARHRGGRRRRRAPVRARRRRRWRAALPGARRCSSGAPNGSGSRTRGRPPATCDGSSRPRRGSTDCCSPSSSTSDVVVTNARGVFDEPIAEWVIGADARVRDGPAPLDRRSAGTATGRQGRRTERLEGAHARRRRARVRSAAPPPLARSPSGMRVTLVGRSARDDEAFGDVIGPDGSHEALADADYVLDALPLTTDDAAAVRRGRLRGDATDRSVHQRGSGRDGRRARADRGAARAARSPARRSTCSRTEPLPADSPLWTMPQVIVSPHVSGDVEGWERAVVAGVRRERAPVRARRAARSTSSTSAPATARRSRGAGVGLVARGPDLA